MRSMCVISLIAMASLGCGETESIGADGGTGATGGTAGTGGTGGTAGTGGTGGTAGTGGTGGTDPCHGVSCDDDNPCTDDYCDSTGQCVYESNQAACDDQDACTELDRCSNGVCVGIARTCVDGNPCTLDLCDEVTGCVFTNVAVPCDDANLCTVGDMCFGGVCGPGAPLDCDDQSGCTSDDCEPESGCKYVYLCDPHATCMAHACECDVGYEGDGYGCQEVHVCGDGHCSSLENFSSCPQDCDHDLVVVVEEAIADLVSPGLRMYVNDLGNAGHLARVEPWGPGTVQELKSFLFSQVDDYDVEGALLVGNLPAAWYEQGIRCVSWDLSQTPPVQIVNSNAL